MKQVIYDTPLFVRGLIDPREPYRHLFHLPPEWRLCLSDLIMREALEVLLGPSGLADAFPSLQTVSLAEAYRRVSTGQVYPVPNDVEIEACQDPNDNKYLASAIAIDCDYLVTEIPELIELESSAEWQEFKRSNSVKVTVTDPAAFVQLVSGS